MTTPHQKRHKIMATLDNRRQQIKTAIMAEERRLFPDSLRLVRLKKLRLAVKDKLYQLRRQMTGRPIPVS